MGDLVRFHRYATEEEPPVSALSETFDSLCHYNPTADQETVDPQQDCGLAAAWHAHRPASGETDHEMYQACEGHLQNVLMLDGVEDFHEFGSACGLPSSYWVHAHGTCATEETLLANGFAWHEVPDAYSKPLHPLPGTHVWIKDIDQWVKFQDGLWVEAEPLNGASR